MKTYQGTHGVHILEYQSKINKLLCYLTNRYPRLIAVRVDLHYPKIVDNGDNICCFPNTELGWYPGCVNPSELSWRLTVPVRCVRINAFTVALYLLYGRKSILNQVNATITFACCSTKTLTTTSGITIRTITLEGWSQEPGTAPWDWRETITWSGPFSWKL